MLSPRSRNDSDERVQLRMGLFEGVPLGLFGDPSALHDLGKLQERGVAPALLLLALDPLHVLNERLETLGLEALLGVVKMQ